MVYSMCDVKYKIFQSKKEAEKEYNLLKCNAL
jgi:hypothetical protein